MQISKEVLTVLSHATVEPKAVILNGQLDRKLYTDTDKVLRLMGGKWHPRHEMPPQVPRRRRRRRDGPRAVDGIDH